jgi:hypothetical protein
MKLYWPQHKVFFVATLALFPERLNGHEVNQLFYRPFFAGDDPQFIEIELADYQKAGYLKYEKPKSLFKITAIDTEKAKKDLLGYLGQWQRDELVALSANKPPDAVRQKELLLASIVRDYANHKNEHRISLENIYGKPSGYAYKPPFWELVLSYQLLDKKIEITYMDYDRRDDGLYDDNSQPTAEFKIIDTGLLSSVKQQTSFIKPLAPVASDSKPRRATIGMTVDGLVYAEFTKEKHHVKKLRRDSAPYNFMSHMLGHQNQDIPRGVVQTKVDGCASKNDMTELAKQCGFTQDLHPLKSVYFGGTTEVMARFKATADLTPTQVRPLLKRKIV